MLKLSTFFESKFNEYMNYAKNSFLLDTGFWLLNSLYNLKLEVVTSLET